MLNPFNSNDPETILLKVITDHFNKEYQYIRIYDFYKTQTDFTHTFKIVTEYKGVQTKYQFSAHLGDLFTLEDAYGDKLKRIYYIIKNKILDGIEPKLTKRIKQKIFYLDLYLIEVELKRPYTALTPPKFNFDSDSEDAIKSPRDQPTYPYEIKWSDWYYTKQEEIDEWIKRKMLKDKLKEI